MEKREPRITVGDQDEPEIITEQVLPPHYNRLRIRLALNGRAVCFPGVSTAENGWSVTMGKFNVRDLTGHRVFLVEPDGISHSTESHLVSAVMTRTTEIAPKSYSLDECAADGWVLIQLGENELEFRGLACTERPCGEVSGVATPRTPSIESASDGATPVKRRRIQ